MTTRETTSTHPHSDPPKDKPAHDKPSGDKTPQDHEKASAGKSPPTVDPPPGKQGYQAQNPNWEEVPVPDWKPGQNPVGTNPPVAAKSDPATTLPPGTNPKPFEKDTAPAPAADDAKKPHASPLG